MEYLLIAMVAFSSCVDSSSNDSLSSSVQSPTTTDINDIGEEDIDENDVDDIDDIDENDIDENEPWRNPFLPKTIVPIRYDLFLFPNFYFNNSVFKGNILIEFKVLNDTNTIIVHMRKLNITQTIVKNCFGQTMKLNRTFEYEENQYWVIQTIKSLPPASCAATLNLTFNGILEIISEETSSVIFGFFKNSYVNEITDTQSWLVATDVEPSNSRLVFPNFDEPQFKVYLTVKLRHWRNYTALSNMEEIFHSDHGDIWRHTMFRKSPKMTSYLACFIISDFASKHNTLIGGQKNRVWARPDRIDKVDYALNIAPVIEKYLYQELQLPYRLGKLDHFAMPEYSSDGGMENWGLIVYADRTLLFDIKKDGDIARQKALSLIAHEMSHNYFGNAVTCRFWNHVWLNEGLSTFYDIKTVTAIDPTLFYEEQHFASKLEELMVTDATTAALPLVPVLTSPGEEESYFDTIRYDKGAAILRMAENFLGADIFRRGIRSYLKEHEYKTVVTDDLWIAMEQINGSIPNLRNIIEGWIYDSGFPVITVELTPFGSATINATQKRFLLDPLAVSDKEYKWYVPLTYRTKGGNCGMTWLNKTDVMFQVHLDSEDDWIAFNYDLTGYYRVKYDDILMNRLIKQLNDNHTVFSELSRLKLLSDALNLAKAEQLGYDTFLSLTQYASKERGYAPWFYIYSSFGVINTMVSGTANFSHFQRYVIHLTSSIMDELQVKDEGSYVEKLLRPKIMSLACYAGHKGCIENTTRLFKAWIQNNTMNPIPVNFRPEAYCIGVAYSSLESEWNTVLERYTMAKSEPERSELLNSLSCSRNVTILERLLEYAINETNMDILDSYALIPQIASNPASEHCIWRWLKNNEAQDEVDEESRSPFSSLMMRSTADQFKTSEQREELLEYLGNTTSKAKKERLLRVLDKNIRWMDRNFPTVINWLEINVPEQSG